MSARKRKRPITFPVRALFGGLHESSAALLSDDTDRTVVCLPGGGGAAPLQNAWRKVGRSEG
jgi:hypothetical protein